MIRKLLFSLFFLLFTGTYAQDIIVTVDGTTIKAYNVDFSPNMVYYQKQNNDSTQIYKIKKSEVLIIKKSNGSKVDPNLTDFDSISIKTQREENKTNFPIIDIEQYHGPLLQQGNCIYITSNSETEYEESAVNRLKERFKQINYWIVVDRPEQAHFILQYGVSTKGHDRAFCFIRTRKSYSLYKTSSLNKSYKVSEPESIIWTVVPAGEEVSQNIDAAESILQHWDRLKERIEKRTLPDFLYVK